MHICDESYVLAFCYHSIRALFVLKLSCQSINTILTSQYPHYNPPPRASPPQPELSHLQSYIYVSPLADPTPRHQGRFLHKNPPVRTVSTQMNWTACVYIFNSPSCDHPYDHIADYSPTFSSLILTWSAPFLRILYIFIHPSVG